MRTLALYIGFNLLCLFAYSQQVYFGYPASMDEVKKGDRIILNIPTNNDGRFIPEKGLNNLTNFLNTDSCLFFRIEIHFCYGNDGFAEKYSRYLCFSLKWYLESACKFSNYDINSCGKSHPIYLDKESEYYSTINTRMEIIVE